jgi:septation ring formation regulator EzrA
LEVLANMDTWLWIVIIAAVVVVIALIAFSIGTRRRTHHRSERLRDRFGPEYDHVVDEDSRRGRREGEAELLRREQEHDELDIHDLNPQTRDRYTREWEDLQRRFVDSPDHSVAEAEQLLTAVMCERGYPVGDEFEQHADLVSVDHPKLVQNFRDAHAVYERSQRREAETEELRRSLLSYRALFEELLA